MSRLYGRAFDVFQISNYIKSADIPIYTEDKKNVSIDELMESSKILDLYIPDEALDYILNNQIHIVKSPFIPKNMTSFASDKNPNDTIFFKGMNFKEEHKRELVFFLGAVLSKINQDELPKSNDLPCEYGDVFPLLLEYIYLKEIGKEDRFLKKHLYCLKYHGDKYQKIYETYQRSLVTNKNNELNFYTQNELIKQDEIYKKREDQFLKDTLTMLIPFSSVDGILQIIDKINTKEELKELIKELYENKNNNRQEILNNIGIESYGYKRLRKEIDIRSNKNE